MEAPAANLQKVSVIRANLMPMREVKCQQKLMLVKLLQLHELLSL